MRSDVARADIDSSEIGALTWPQSRLGSFDSFTPWSSCQLTDQPTSHRMWCQLSGCCPGKLLLDVHVGPTTHKMRMIGPSRLSHGFAWAGPNESNDPKDEDVARKGSILKTTFHVNCREVSLTNTGVNTVPAVLSGTRPQLKLELGSNNHQM